MKQTCALVVGLWMFALAAVLCARSACGWAVALLVDELLSQYADPCQFARPGMWNGMCSAELSGMVSLPTLLCRTDPALPRTPRVLALLLACRAAQQWDLTLPTALPNAQPPVSKPARRPKPPPDRITRRRRSPPWSRPRPPYRRDRPSQARLLPWLRRCRNRRPRFPSRCSRGPESLAQHFPRSM